MEQHTVTAAKQDNVAVPIELINKHELRDAWCPEKSEETKPNISLQNLRITEVTSLADPDVAKDPAPLETPNFQISPEEMSSLPTDRGDSTEIFTSPTSPNLSSKRKSGNPQKVQKEIKIPLEKGKNIDPGPRLIVTTLPGGDILAPKRGRPPKVLDSLNEDLKKPYLPPTLANKPMAHTVNGGIVASQSVNPEVVAEFSPDTGGWNNSYCSQVYQSQIDIIDEGNSGAFPGLDLTKRKKRGRPPKVRSVGGPLPDPLPESLPDSPLPKLKRGRHTKAPDSSFVDIETAVAIDSAVQGINEDQSELDFPDEDNDLLHCPPNTSKPKRRYTEPAAFYSGIPFKAKKKRGRPRKVPADNSFLNGSALPTSNGDQPRVETPYSGAYDRSLTVQTLHTSSHQSTATNVMTDNKNLYPLFSEPSDKKSTKPKKLRTEATLSHRPTSEVSTGNSQVLTSDSQVLTGDSQVLTGNSQVLPGISQVLTGDQRLFEVKNPLKFPHGFSTFKKKRGRPRKPESQVIMKVKKKMVKPQKQKPNETVLPSGHADVHTVSGTFPVLSPDGIPTPRKRGRPRKFPDSPPPQATSPSPLRTEIINGEKTICLQPSDSKVTFEGSSVTHQSQFGDIHAGEGPSGLSTPKIKLKTASAPISSGKRRGRPPKEKHESALTVRIPKASLDTPLKSPGLEGLSVRSLLEESGCLEDLTGLLAGKKSESKEVLRNIQDNVTELLSTLKRKMKHLLKIVEKKKRIEEEEIKLREEIESLEINVEKAKGLENEFSKRQEYADKLMSELKTEG